MLANALVASVLSVFLSLNGLRKESLSSSGAIGACIVGFVTFLSGVQFGMTLIVFYLTCSKLTKFQQTKKQLIEADFQAGGKRDIFQVLSNSLTGTLLCMSYLISNGDSSPVSFNSDQYRPLVAGFITFYSTCTGDTWASELGVLSPSHPIMITTFRPVLFSFDLFHESHIM